MLCEEFPSSAFDARSLRAVVEADPALTWFPAFAELRARLAVWWRDHQPSPMGFLPPPGSDAEQFAGWTAFDHAALAHWHKRRAEIFASGQHPYTGSCPEQAPLARLASLVRQLSAKAWARIAEGNEAVPVLPPEIDPTGDSRAA